MYYIYYTSILQYGYVKISFFKRNKQIAMNNHEEGQKFATKFKSKWWANFNRKLLQSGADFNGDLRTFYVQKID